ncbi:MAG: hypothetical protein ABJ205_10150 [Erythrobacter sp.]|uniref:hypothetical protein n=1 Tax=Erythrobacter sp. TaxID=1042 RepID=UPI003264A148
MSNQLFENPKVALGFSGVVVAVALVASVAFQEFSGSDKAPQGTIADATVAEPAPQQTQAAGFAPSADSGWGGDAGATDDWGAPSVSTKSSDIEEATVGTPVFTDHASKRTYGSGAGRSSGSRVTTSSAPSAPKVRPPETGFKPELQVVDN